MALAGIYLHIPFCRSRCSYCDFATDIYDRPLAERYVDALVEEINTWRAVAEPREVDTIYFGGGTPSLLTPAQTERILAIVHARFMVRAAAEVTMEMNPGTVTAQSLRELRRLGVNRASFGAQTFDDRELRRLGRSHTADDAKHTFAELREANFDNINLDLIAGLPGQTQAAWARNIDIALALRPEHLSLYLLEVHEGTPLAAQIRRGVQPAPSDDAAAEMYEFMLRRVAGAGYEHYEISNFCLPGSASRHNTKYWTGAPVYGFGCSAHSFDGAHTRWSNERDAARYAALVEQGQSPVVEKINLSTEESRAESLFLGLRLMRGIDLHAHRARFGVDPCTLYASDLHRLSDAGLVEITDDTLKLTRSGALLSNEVFAAFL